MKRLAALLLSVVLALALAAPAMADVLWLDNENLPEAEETTIPETETAAEEDADPARYTIGPAASTVVIVIVAAAIVICVVPIKKKDQP